MKDIIKITNRQVNDDNTQTVNARELHEFLGVKTRFNDWIVNRIAEYDFLEEIDFVSFTENLVSGGKRKEYFISLDMAKELSMVERNEKGKQARQYFIAMEKKSKQPNEIDFSHPRVVLGVLENMQAQLTMSTKSREAKYQAWLHRDTSEHGSETVEIAIKVNAEFVRANKASLKSLMKELQTQGA